MNFSEARFPAEKERGVARSLKSRRLIATLLLGIIGWCYLYPFWWMIGSSLKSPREFFEDPLRLLPATIQWSNYPVAWVKAGFGAYFLNTLWVTTWAVAGVILVSALAGYALGRNHFPGKAAVQAGLIFTLILPANQSFIPVFDLMLKLRLTGTLWPVILLAIVGKSSLAVLLYSGYFAALPEEMAEAARLDGAGHWIIFWRIMLPLAAPVTGTVTLLTTLGVWNDFFYPVIFTLTKPELRTLAVGMFAFLGENTRDWTVMLAASVMSLAPIILLFLCLQRYFVDAVAGAVR